MEYSENVLGMKSEAKPIVIGKDTVYIHDNIQKYEFTNELSGKLSELYTYREIRYGFDEYLKKVMEENDTLKKEVLATQLALCEMYEKKNG